MNNDRRLVSKKDFLFGKNILGIKLMCSYRSESWLEFILSVQLKMLDVEFRFLRLLVENGVKNKQSAINEQLVRICTKVLAKDAAHRLWLVDTLNMTYLSAYRLYSSEYKSGQTTKDLNSLSSFACSTSICLSLP